MQQWDSPVVALILLPQEYNPDDRGRRRPVEDEKFQKTMEEIAGRFGGGVLWKFEQGAARGYWWDRDLLYRDELVAIEVDIPDDAAAKDWLARYAREVLIPRFEQEAIYIKIVGPIQVITVTVNDVL